MKVETVKVEVKNADSVGITWRYLKKFFDEQKGSKDDWEAVLDLMKQACSSATDTDYSDKVVGKAMGIVGTYGGGKYSSKKTIIDNLLNKVAASVNAAKNAGSDILPKHNEFCPEINKARERINDILGAIGS